MAVERLRRIMAKVVIALGAVAALIAGGTMIAYPAAAAVACPACYGFQSLGHNLFVEASMSPEQRTHTSAVVDQARDQVASFYGTLSGSPRILVCTTSDCYRRVGGGGSRGMALLTFALLLSQRGIDPVIAAHELSHIELHNRLGLVRTVRRAVPQWFDEGVAVVVSNDPRYLVAPDRRDRCIVADAGDLPTTRSAWTHGAANDNLYAKAACRVSRWIADKGGPRAVIDLISQVAQGRDFDSAYR
jgi:hypothetical protein